jgi:hypothetical protein
VALVKTDVSEEGITSIIRVKKISELGTKLQLATDALLMVTMSVFIRATGRQIPEDGILNSHRRENLKIFYQ